LIRLRAGRRWKSSSVLRFLELAREGEGAEGDQDNCDTD
jgi:hypothetical protein